MQSVGQWLFCIVFILYAAGAYYYFQAKTNNYLNPFGISIAVWNLIAGISSLHLSYLQQEWNFEMYFAISLYSFTVSTVGLFICNRYKVRQVHKSVAVNITNTYIICSRVLFIICMICAFLEWRHNGFLVYREDLANEASDIKNALGSNGIAFVHYGTVFWPFCSLLSTFELIYRRRKGMFQYIYYFISFTLPLIHSYFILLSRGTLLIVALGVVYIVNDRYEIPLRIILIIVAVFIAGFVAMALVRVSLGSLMYKVIPNHPFLSALYGYTGLNFENLYKLVQRGPRYTIAKQSFWGIWQTLGFGTLMTPPEAPIQTEFFNATTICYPFYNDLGLFGIGIYTLIYYFLLGFCYHKSVYDKRYVLLMAALQKAIWTAFFSNYFLSNRILAFPFAVILMLIFLMKYRIVLKR